MLLVGFNVWTKSLHLEDFSKWARGNGLEILLIAVGSILATRFVHWISAHVINRMDTSAQVSDQAELPRSERIKYVHAVSQAVDWTTTSLIYFIALVLILVRFNVPLTSFVAPATVLGVALGFGAQKVVQDLLAGFFIFVERQFGVGDIIRITVPGSVTGVAGTVEEITLRITRLRTVNGELVIVPNSEIRQLMNLSRDWSQVLVDIPIPADQDHLLAREVLEAVVNSIISDESFSSILLEAPIVTGVESIMAGYITIRMMAKTLPSKQFDVAREMRTRALNELKSAGISAYPSTVQVVHPVI